MILRMSVSVAEKISRTSHSPSAVSVVKAWPRDVPLFVLHSGREHPAWSRYSVLTTPVVQVTAEENGTCHWSATGGDAPPLPQRSADPLQVLRDLLHGTSIKNSIYKAELPRNMPQSGWIGYLAYELGRVLEPAATLEYALKRGLCRFGLKSRATAANRSGGELFSLGYCPGMLVHDNNTGRWHTTGTWAEKLPPRIEDSFRTAVDSSRAAGSGCAGCVTGNIRSETTRAEHEEAVARAVEYIHAGDAFQVNITRRINGTFAGNIRDLFLTSCELAPAWYSSLLEIPLITGKKQALLSMSPELFLKVDGETRKVITRPIKGTLAADQPVELLKLSEKDAAELHMIVDLCRNDLGRVCEKGSIKVSEARVMETHPTVHHGAATIEGILLADAEVTDLLRATFPAGSVTGTPKIRAMQIIEELEKSPRGVYCGAIGYFGDDGSLALNVAIRTLQIREKNRDQVRRGNALPGMFHEAEFVYGTGGGIVADSLPDAEYQETVTKSAVLQKLCKAASGEK